MTFASPLFLLQTRRSGACGKKRKTCGSSARLPAAVPQRTGRPPATCRWDLLADLAWLSSATTRPPSVRTAQAAWPSHPAAAPPPPRSPPTRSPLSPPSTPCASLLRALRLLPSGKPRPCTPSLRRTPSRLQPPRVHPCPIHRH